MACSPTPVQPADAPAFSDVHFRHSAFDRAKNTGVAFSTLSATLLGCITVVNYPLPTLALVAVAIAVFIGVNGTHKYGAWALWSSLFNTAVCVVPACLIAQALLLHGPPSLRQTVVVFFEIFGITGYCMSVCLHRYFSHAAFRTSRPFQLAIAALGSCCLQGDPIWWASKHRRHHKHCDEPEDPHSWQQTSHWYAWWGWTLSPSEQHTDAEYVSALLAQPELVLFCRFWWVWPVFVNALMYKAFGFYTMVLYTTAPMLMSRFVTLLFNVEYHPVREDCETACGSINLASFFADLVGESCHDDHHAYPRRACRPSAGCPWIDVPYYTLIWPWMKLGLVWEVQDPKQANKRA